MRYTMKQQRFCAGEDYVVRDEAGRDFAYLDGKVFTLRQTLNFLDAKGEVVAKIVKRLLSIGPVYDVYRGGAHFATISEKSVAEGNAKFFVDVPGPDDYDAAGDFGAHEYTFVRRGKTVATVSKKWATDQGEYGVELDADEDAILLIACTVVIDLCCQAANAGY